MFDLAVRAHSGPWGVVASRDRSSGRALCPRARETGGAETQHVAFANGERRRARAQVAAERQQVVRARSEHHPWTVESRVPSVRDVVNELIAFALQLIEPALDHVADAHDTDKPAFVDDRDVADALPGHRQHQIFQSVMQ